MAYNWDMPTKHNRIARVEVGDAEVAFQKAKAFGRKLMAIPKNDAGIAKKKKPRKT
jgi:hypothetical protein